MWYAVKKSKGVVMGIFPMAEAIIGAELARFGLGPEALKCGLRTKTITNARKTIRKRLRNDTLLTWREIDWLVGLRPDLEKMPRAS